MIKKIIAICLLALVAVVACSCGSSVVDLENCSIIYSATDGDNIKAAAERLHDSLGIENLPLSSDAASTESDGLEILIGNTNRAESVKYTRDSELYYLDYVIRLEGNKVVIIGGSNKATVSAVEYFITEFLDGNKISFKNYDYKHEYTVKTLAVDGKNVTSYNAITTATDGSFNAIVDNFCNRFTELTGFKQSNEPDALNVLIKCDKDLASDSYSIKISNGDVTFAGANAYGIKAAIDSFFGTVMTTNATLKEGDVFSGTFEMEQTKYDNYIIKRTPLYNTYYKLMTEKELNIVYFGGSVTAGHGATNSDLTSWRGLVSSWFASSFPNAKINNYNAAIGGSGSHHGAFRCENDVLNYKPDLVFVEFAMNDAYCGTNRSKIKLYYESIVRQIKEAYPECDIVSLYITDKSSASDTVLPNATQAQEFIAEAYGISSINLGGAICSTINYKDDAEWSKHFIDIVHPTDAGYAAYFEAIKEFLESELVLGNAYSNEIKTTALPDKVNDSDFNPIYLTTDKMEIVENKGWEYKENSNWPETNSYRGYYSVANDDNSFTVKFKGGTNLALYAEIGKNRVYYKIDGGDEKIVASNGNQPHVLSVKIDDNPEAEHTLTLRVKNKNEAAFILRGILVW